MKKSAKAANGAENRREPLVDAAAKLFATKGYAATSTRDIAAAVNMQPGSIYYHFKSKEEILRAVYHEGIARFVDALDVALADTSIEPWDRLKVACTTHLEILLEGGAYAKIITPEFVRSFPPDLQKELIADRDEYEARFDALLQAVPMRAGVNRWLLRAALFGALNWTSVWYRPGPLDPADIAVKFLDFFSSVRK